PVVRVVEQPVYVFRRELKVPRGLAILIVYVAIGLLLMLTTQIFSPLITQQVEIMKANWPKYQQTAINSFNDVVNWMRHLRLPQQWQSDLQTRAGHLVENVGTWFGDVLLGAVGYVTYLIWAIAVPIFSFFLLKDAERIERGIEALLPNERLRKRMHWLLLDVSRTLALYIRAQITA